MNRVCLSDFKFTAWSTRLRNTIKKALETQPNKFTVDIVDGLPKEKYDLLFLCGIRSITKSNLDIDQLKNLSKYIIEFGDTIDDPRDKGADLYFFFNPSEKKIDGKKFLPKIIDENFLYPEQEKKLTIYVDHYAHKNLQDAELSRKAIKFVFQQIMKLKSLDMQFDIFYHSDVGIEKNPKLINFPKFKNQNCKFINFEEICKYYRKTHLFFPTHHETQGMLAQEIGLCGGMTILQPWMYPKETHHQFKHMLYDFENPLDIYKLISFLNDPNFIEKNREHTLKYCSNSLFNKIFLKEVSNLIE